MVNQTKFSGRLLELGGEQYTPLFHDLFKSISIMIVIEIAQRYFLPQIYLDGVYHVMMLFVLIGQIIYHLIIDKIIGAGGPQTLCCPFLGLRELADEKKGESTSSAEANQIPLGHNMTQQVEAQPLPIPREESEPKPFGGFF
jgi:hypothetical protein